MRDEAMNSGDVDGSRAGGRGVDIGTFPDPDVRIREGAEGVAVILADGREWLLADGGLCNALDEIRDRIFDDSILQNSVKNSDIIWAAWVLLGVNYRLSTEEGRALLLDAEMDGLAAAVCEALFGPSEPRRSYSAWARSQMLANGIDPTAVPGEMRRLVLETLVRTKRAIPCGEFCDAAEAAGQREMLRGMIRPGVTP